MKTNANYSFSKGLKDGLPIGLGYLSVSFAFGVQASILGLPILLTVLISMTNLTSAGQLAGLNVIATASSLAFAVIEIALSQLVINARYFLMSISLTQKMDDSFTFRHRLFCSTFVTDEIFAVSAAKTRPFGNKYFYGLALLPYLGWSLGTLLGAAAGNILPAIVTGALGIALYAMFIAIIIPPSIQSKGVLLAVVMAAAISAAFYYLPFFAKISSGLSIIITALITALILAAIFPVKENEKENEDETK